MLETSPPTNINFFKFKTYFRSLIVLDGVLEHVLPSFVHGLSIDHNQHDLDEGVVHNLELFLPAPELIMYVALHFPKERLGNYSALLDRFLRL